MARCECFFTPLGEVAVMCEQCEREQLRRKTKAIMKRNQNAKARPRQKRKPAVAK